MLQHRKPIFERCYKQKMTKWHEKGHKMLHKILLIVEKIYLREFNVIVKY